MVVALMGAGILKEHLNRGQVLAIAVGFAGVVLAINPWAGELQGERIGYIVMIGSVVCFSSNVIVSRFLMRTETPESLLLVASCSQFIVGTLLTLGHGTFVPFTGSWSVLGGVGLFNMVGTAFYLLALRDAKAATVSSFHYSQLVFGAILGYLIWGDVPTLSMALGAMVIAASGFYVAHQVKRTG